MDIGLLVFGLELLQDMKSQSGDFSVSSVPEVASNQTITTATVVTTPKEAAVKSVIPKIRLPTDTAQQIRDRIKFGSGL
jgi:hypothetical protein